MLIRITCFEPLTKEDIDSLESSFETEFATEAKVAVSTQSTRSNAFICIFHKEAHEPVLRPLDQEDLNIRAEACFKNWSARSSIVVAKYSVTPAPVPLSSVIAA